MKSYRWSPAKNAWLRRERHVSFEQIVVAIESGGLLDVLEHPNPRRYPRQRVLVVADGGYVFLVPFVEEDDHLFLKTVLPSRKARREYLEKGANDGE
jgi:hypothetical protein